ncbi:MAG: septum formation initiator family protein [Micrococcaceae bacterium]
MAENRSGRRVKKAQETSVNRANIDFSLSSRKKKKLKISEQAKSKISTSRTSELAARRTVKEQKVRETILGREDSNVPKPAKTFNGKMLMGIATAFICFMLLFNPVKSFVKQNNDIRNLEQQVQVAQAKHDEAQEIDKKWQDSEFVKQQARARLGFSIPGETNYVSVGKAAQAEESVAEQDGNAQSQYDNKDLVVPPQDKNQTPPWYSTFMDSYKKASSGK